MIEYTGYIRKIRFYNESSNYIVALIDVEQEDKLITMNGYMNNFNCKQCDAYYDEEYVDVRIWICEKCENSMVEILG